MIGFTAPWVLLGLLAAGIPVLLHLFARREPPTVMFPATRYLAERMHAILVVMVLWPMTSLQPATAQPTAESSRVAA